MKREIVVVACLFIVIHLNAEIKRVPQDYGTIRQAIAASTNGDTVLVDHGRYYENIRFGGKSVVVASKFLLDGDSRHILETVIDGSQPSHPDTASCVLIVDGETRDAMLVGFTLTGGKGTRWQDEHNGLYYREGGGILITLSAPTIRFNYIVNNEGVDPDRCSSAGGGAIRVGDGAPLIENNVLTHNRGMYGGGVVLNYCAGAVIRNNIIADNNVIQYRPNAPTYGGGGVWIGNQQPGSSAANIVINNTIIGNTAYGDPGLSFIAGRAGGIVVHSGAVTVIKNNIVWNNFSTLEGEIYLYGNQQAVMEYNNVRTSIQGTGNISASPLFEDSAYILKPASPGVDAGSPEPELNDPSDGTNPLYPARGTLRNDQGAYGGPSARALVPFARPVARIRTGEYKFPYTLPAVRKEISIPVMNVGSAPLALTGYQFASGNLGEFDLLPMLPITIRSGQEDTIRLGWTPSSSRILTDTLVIGHNDSLGGLETYIVVRGTSVPTPLITLNATEHNFGALSASLALKETTFTVSNLGTGPDSLDISIDYRGVQPDSCLAVSPKLLVLPADDSANVTFTIYPSLVKRTLTSRYNSDIVIHSRNGNEIAELRKTMLFQIVGTSGIEAAGGTAPAGFILHSNYPNPFNPTTVIPFSLGTRSNVTLKAYDLLGRLAAVIAEGTYAPGHYEAKWNAFTLPSGIYFVTLSVVQASSGEPGAGGMPASTVRSVMLLK